jgi:hypothetical protein
VLEWPIVTPAVVKAQFSRDRAGRTE